MNKKNYLKRKNNEVFDNNVKTWKIMFLIFIFINMCMIGFSWYLFLQINDNGIFNIKQDNTVSVETIDRELLNDINTSFKSKKDGFEKLKTDTLSVIDPSL